MKKPDESLEKFRVTHGPLASDSSYGMNGLFIVPGPRGIKLACIVSDGGGWDHVSVERLRGTEISTKVPYWDEMCAIKHLFFEDNEVVVQFHPAEAEYVNVHPGVLHLWRYQATEFPTPPKLFV